MKITVKKKNSKKHLLKNVTIEEVSSVGRGANEGAQVTLLKTAKANLTEDKGDLPPVLKSKEEEAMDKEAMEKLQKGLEEVQAKLEKSEFMAALNDAEKVHYAGLNDDGKAVFEKMDSDARGKEIAKKVADDETFESDGVVIKKSEVGPGVFTLLKAQKIATEAAVAKAEKLEADAIQKGLEVEAEKLWPNTVGSASDKAVMLKSIRSMPEVQQEAQMKMMKAADEALAKSFKEVGQAGGAETGTATEKLNKMAEEKAAKDNVSVAKAYTAILDTEEGAQLYKDALSGK